MGTGPFGPGCPFECSGLQLGSKGIAGGSSHPYDRIAKTTVPCSQNSASLSDTSQPHVCILIYLHIYICIYVCICMWIYIYIYMYIYKYLYMYTHIPQNLKRHWQSFVSTLCVELATSGRGGKPFPQLLAVCFAGGAPSAADGEPLDSRMATVRWPCLDLLL